MSKRTFSVESLRSWINSYGYERNSSSNYRIKRALKKLSIWLGFHAAIRYSPFVCYVQNSGIKNPSILEIGSGPIGITNYLKRNVTGLDIDPRGPLMGTLQLVKGLANSLPFDDAKFDFTVSVDFLEHILPSDRKKVISEMIRVTKGDVLIGTPCGEKVRKWEKKVKDIYKRKLALWHKKDPERESFIKKRGSFLSEHEEMGLPGEREIIDSINETLAETASRPIEIINNESLWVWYLYVLAELRYSYLRWFITTLLAMILLPLLKRVGWGGYYKKIFIIK